MNIEQLIKRMILEELENRSGEYKIGPGSKIPAGEVTLYHISPNPNLTVIDPAAASGSRKTYSASEFKSWDQDRVFFFTEKGQKDTGIGPIPGETVYVVKVDRSELYDLNNDEPNYFDDWTAAKERFNKKRNTAPYSAVNQFELFKSLLEEDAPQVKGFIYKQGNEGNVIVALYEPVTPVGTMTTEEYYNDSNN